MGVGSWALVVGSCLDAFQPPASVCPGCHTLQDMAETLLATKVDEARAALDRHVVDVRRMALQSGDGHAVLARVGGEGGVGSASRDPLVRRSRQVRALRGRVAARRAGATLGAARALADRPVFVFETGGTTGIPKTRINIDDFRTDYELFSRTLPDEHFPRGSNWLMLGPSGPRRLRLAVEHLAQSSRRHLLLRRSRPAVGHQADQERLDGSPEGVSGARHRSGRHHPVRRARHPLHVHDPEAARSAGPPARNSRARRFARPASRESSPAARNSRRSGTASPTKSCSTART